MNSEYALNNIKTIIEDGINDMLDVIDIEVNASVATPNPVEFAFGNRDTNIITQYPAVLVVGKESLTYNDQYRFQERQLNFEIVVWITQNDIENLHRFILRYSDAIARLLRNEDNWTTDLNTPVIKTLTYTDIYQTNVGYAEGCSITGSVNYFIS